MKVGATGPTKTKRTYLIGLVGGRMGLDPLRNGACFRGGGTLLGPPPSPTNWSEVIGALTTLDLVTGG